jgi:hypothetical protein
MGGTMNAFQSMISMVLLIFVLSVVVQAIQEVLKELLNTKANVMGQVMDQFMGQHLPLDQIKTALSRRGLQITALEHFDSEAFRHLLDGMNFQNPQLQTLLPSGQQTLDRFKENIASSYEAARAMFQAVYTRRNKQFVLVTTFLVVILLNANIISLYNQISVDSIVQQTLLGQAQRIKPPEESQQGDLKIVYNKSREQISSALEQYPILLRTSKFKDDFAHPVRAALGLLVMGSLVSLGAPFWNDVLKSITGINNALGTRRM